MKRVISLSIILSVLLFACTNKTTPQTQVDASADAGTAACDAGDCDAG